VSHSVDEQFRSFVRDEEGALRQLRHFVGALAPRLDGTPDSLAIVDAFLDNLIADSGWADSPLFADVSSDMPKWLTVRLAYYVGWCLKEAYGTSWSLCPDPESDYYQTPVMKIGEVMLSPLDIARARIQGALEGGLQGLFADLLSELHGTADGTGVH